MSTISIAYLAIILLVCMFLSLAQDDWDTAPSASGTIAYVIDPFDALNDKTRIHLPEEKGYLNLSLSSDALFGSHALQVDYGVQRTERWGGLAAFSLLSPGKRAFNCMGATHLSFWYRVLEPQSLPGHVHLRVALMDDSDCEHECDDIQSQELYYSLHHVLDETDSEWREVKIELRGGSDNSFPFWRTGWAGQEGNRELDLDRITGYYVEMSIDAGVDAKMIGQGSFLVDQLACVGGSDLFGAALRGGTSMKTAVAEGRWYGDVASRGSRAEFRDSALVWNYTIEQIQSWGAFLSISHAAPEASYYNLSLASTILLDYEVNTLASPAGRATLRFVLNDAKDCTKDCHTYNKPDVETFYSFHDILDDPQTLNGTIEIHVDRKAESYTTVSNVFSGGSGNGRLDTDHIKAYRFEIDVDSNGSLASQVTGSVSFKNLRALVVRKGRDESDDDMDTTADSKSCIVERGVSLRAKGGQSSSFLSKEFRSKDCCRACEEEEDCIYAVSDEFHCWIASELIPEDIVLTADTSMKTYWHVKNDIRGDFCEVCDCRDRTIDCRGKNLTMVPQTLLVNSELGNETMAWAPSILDLRDNPHLVFVGSGALREIKEWIEEVRFPTNLTYLSPDCLRDLPLLRVVTFEGQAQESFVPPSKQMKINGRPANVISSPNDFFGDVCCYQSARLETELPVGGLSFCELDPTDIPGSDAVYEEFVEYFRPTELISKLTSKSKFMSEAAESAEKCAEYCNVINTCNYFSYDGRVKATDHTCYLSVDNGTSHDACCSPDDYADFNRTLPGWISGRVPRARREVDNARVIITGKDLKATVNNGYAPSFMVSLGSMPIRGAVWIEPTLASNTGVQVAITPPRLVFYDNETTATVKVEVLSHTNLRSEQRIEIVNKVQACDSAFTAVSAAKLAEETSVFVTVEHEKASEDLLPWVAVPLVSIVMIVLTSIFYYKRREAGDALWKVKMDDVELYDPLTLLGEGTFGLILLAEYRGTQIAVKPVLPRREDILLNSERKLLGKFGQKTNTLRLEKQPSVYSEMMGEAREEERSTTFDSVVESGLFHKSMGMESQELEYDLTDQSESISEVDCCAPLRRRNKHKRLKRDFVREMRHLSKLRHPCLTTIMGAVMDRTEVPFIMLEFMEHGSLYDLLHNETMTIDGEFILPVLRDIVSGIRFLHATQPQIVHGDLRAQNVLLDLKFRAKVTGFGFSQKDKMGISQRPWWTAPEVLRGESEKTTESDAYAFGMTLYEIYSRQDPFEGDSSSSVLPLVLDPTISRRPPVPSGCPPEIQKMITDCLYEVPECRPTFDKLEINLRELHHSNINPVEKRSSMRFGANKLMFDVFPPHIAEALRDGREIEPELRDMVTIFFCDIVGFTDISSQLPPMKIAEMLDRLYTKFDELSDRHDVFKVETIGDAYMAVTNLVKDQPTDHAKRLAEFAIDVVTAANHTLVDRDHPEKGFLQIRVGLHSGSVVADVVGSKSHRPRYCLFGDTVNTASRMESNSKENRIHCSEVTAHLLSSQCPDMPICHRGGIQVKGKGKMHTYWVNEAGGTGLRPDWGSTASRSVYFRGSIRDIMGDSTVGQSRRSLYSEPDQEDSVMDNSRTSDRGGGRRRRRRSMRMTSRRRLANVREAQGH